MQRLAEPRSLAEKHPSLTLRLDREKSRFPFGVSRLDNPHSSLCSLVSNVSCLFLCSLFLTFQHFASLFEGRHTEKERYKTYKRKRKIVLVWRPICSNTQRRRSFPARALAPIAFTPQLHKQAHSFQTQRTVTMVLGTFFFFCAERTRFSLYLYPFGVRWNARKKEKLHTYVSECVIEKTVLRWQGAPCKRETEPLPVHFLSFFFFYLLSVSFLSITYFWILWL